MDLDANPRKCKKRGVKKPIPREWTDSKTGKTYWRVRWNDVNGKESVSVFGTPEAAEEHAETIFKARKLFGRAAAANQDEIAGLAFWRKFVAAELEAGRDAPSLRDVLMPAVERFRSGKTSPALDDLREQFLVAKQREMVSQRHLDALKNRLKRFVSYFDENEPSGAVTTEAVERAMASMRAGGMSPQTVKGVRTAAHGLYQWAVDRDLVTVNPVARAKAPKVTQGEVGTITASQLKGLLKTALAVMPRAVPALAVWAFCGVRRAELCRLRFEDLDTKRKELRVSAKAAKTGVARFVPVPAALTAWLEAATEAGVAPIGQLVPGDSEAKCEGQLNRWLLDAREKAGFAEWPNNALRHSFASHACALYDDFPKVSAWLGHSGDPRLLVARYRHAVAKDAGKAWFNVLPTDDQEKAKEQTRRKAPAKKTA